MQSSSEPRQLRDWIKFSKSFLTSLLIILATAVHATAETPPAGILGQETDWATPWYVIEGDDEGPTVLITGGIHGNESAGNTAAEQIRHWEIDRGRLIVIPRVNQLGIKADMRWFPPERNNKPLRDLNRNFPTKTNVRPRGQVAIELWEFVQTTQPDYVIDLHEGFDFHIANEKSVGASVIFTKSEHRTELATAMLDAVNSTVTDENRKLVPLSRSGAVVGSLVRACQDSLGIDGFILETCFKDQPLSLRSRQHREMVSTLIQKIGLTNNSRTNRLAPDSSPSVIQVGMFDGAGTSGAGIENFEQLFAASQEFSMTQIGPADMQPNVLQQFDVLLFPGGSGSKQGKDIGENGRTAIQNFVREGGGIIGVCAGAYLCSSHYDWSLHVVNTAVYNRMVEIPGVGRKSMWYRGESKDVEIEFDEAASSIFGRNGFTEVRYHNGPIVSPGKNTALPDYTPLAWFRSEVSRYEPQKGTMINTPAIITAPYGSGKVLCISPHPESTPGLESTILKAVQYVNAREKSIQIPE